MVGQLRFHEGILSLYLSMVDLDPSLPSLSEGDPIPSLPSTPGGLIPVEAGYGGREGECWPPYLP